MNLKMLVAILHVWDANDFFGEDRKNIIKASTPKFTVETHENKSSEEMKSKDP